MASKYLTIKEANQLISYIKQFTPVVTGNLKSSVQFIRHTNDGFEVGVGISKTSMAGANPAKYAVYVNYGHEWNPRSKKLAQDYHFVEKAIEVWSKYLKRSIDLSPSSVLGEVEEDEDE